MIERHGTHVCKNPDCNGEIAWSVFLKKDRLKEVSSTIGISVNDYIARLIKADIDKDHKHEEVVSMLNRWEVKGKYHPMIETASFLPSSGYTSPYYLFCEVW